MWGCQEGDKKPGGCLGPLLPLPPGGGNARLAHRQPFFACGGKPPERRNRLPSADGIASKKRAFRLSLELEYDARKGAHADEHDRMHLRQLPDRDRKHKEQQNRAVIQYGKQALRTAPQVEMQ